MVDLLQYFLGRFLGGNRGMDSADQVEIKLLNKFKQVKAARLTSFWLYVQKFGSEKAKQVFGNDSYYASKRDLKAADVSLIEPPKLVLVDKDFIQSFKFELPSPHVTNIVDDFRDSDNILNLPIRLDTNEG